MVVVTIQIVINLSFIIYHVINPTTRTKTLTFIAPQYLTIQININSSEKSNETTSSVNY